VSIAEWNSKPPTATDDRHFGAWFADLAARLLNATDLLIDGKPYRFAELEAYYYGEGHPDPFTHRDPLQYQNGRWYFHRTGGEYRSGSFKGVDLTFGDGGAMFGVLVRTIVAADGTVIDGPSLTVDHILSLTGTPDVPTLDDRIAGRRVWDESSPLAVRESAAPRTQTVYRTARVGLSLKRSRKGRTDTPMYLMRPYRFLTEPRGIGKGKPQLVCALHQGGLDAATITGLTGTPRKTVERYVSDFEAGKQEASFDAYFGVDLGPAGVCKLLGAWTAKYGSTGV
jgi:hypothetical protein